MLAGGHPELELVQLKRKREKERKTCGEGELRNPARSSRSDSDAMDPELDAA